jgi:hypothetical protein
VAQQPFVFLSHAGADKPRLKPLIDALQRAGLKIWIDNPAGFDAAHSQQFYRIHAGNRWQDEIYEALEACACVLVCWSKQATDRRVKLGRRKLVWLEEATIGRFTGKLVSCVIDSIDPNDLPGTHSAHHFRDVSPDLPQERLQIELDLLVQDVKSVVTRMMAPAKGRDAGFRDDMAPYLVDRTEHEAVIMDAIKELDAAAGGIRPVFLIGPSNELPDEFQNRTLRSRDNLVSGGSRIVEYKVEWPKSEVPLEAFTAAYRKSLWYKIGRSGSADDRAIAMALAEMARPVAAVQCILWQDWTTQEIDRIRLWLDWWNSLAELTPNIKVILWLQVTLSAAKPGWRDCPPGRSRLIWQWLRGLKAKISEAGPGFDLVMPPVLPPIQQRDARDWINQVRPDPGVERLKLKEEIDRLYPEAGFLGLFTPRACRFGINHQEFAKAVQSFFAAQNP